MRTWTLCMDTSLINVAIKSGVARALCKHVRVTLSISVLHLRLRGYVVIYSMVFICWHSEANFLR